MEEVDTKGSSVLNVLGELENLLDSKLVKPETDPNIISPLEVTSKKGDLVCKICNFQSKSRQGLRIHKNKYHNVAKFICRFCGLKAFSRSGMKRHIKEIHEQSKKVYINCDVCKAKTTKDEIYGHYSRYHAELVSEGKINSNISTKKSSKISTKNVSNTSN